MTQKSEEAFKLKANFLPVTVIKFLRCDQRSVTQQLKEIHRSAPNYFHQSPVIIDVTQVKRPAKGLDIDKLSQLLREYQLIPVGIQGLYPQEEGDAHELGLALWHNQSDQPAQKEIPVISSVAVSPKRLNTVITKPVRSGMRVYAKESNLVLLAPVSSGAECIADGDIFCYAPVRGRILAGASGDDQAQIFCQSIDAELISISGYYLLYDECPEEKTGYFQIFLKDNKIQISNFLLERSVTCQK